MDVLMLMSIIKPVIFMDVFLKRENTHSARVAKKFMHFFMPLPIPLPRPTPRPAHLRSIRSLLTASKQIIDILAIKC
jgi:hypothetical protein